jgi:drug/metabolite transporter (DMT)-like permease
MCWGLGSVYGRHAPHPEQPLLASAVEMICAGVALAVLGGLGGEFGRVDLSSDVTGSLLAVGYLIVFGSLIAYTAYEWLLRNAPPRITGTYAFVNPVVAVLLGWWLLNEELSPRTILAGAVIAVGVALIVLGQRAAAEDPPPGSHPHRSSGSRPDHEPEPARCPPPEPDSQPASDPQRT